MNLIREFRIIPTVLIAISCLVVLKVAGLLLDGGYILNDKSSPPKMSWAQENLGFPASRPAIDTTDITGSVGAKKEAKPETKPETIAAPEPPDGQVIYPEPGRPVTASERAVLERLQSRRQEIEARAREIDIRESLINSAEKRIEGKT